MRRIQDFADRFFEPGDTNGRRAENTSVDNEISTGSDHEILQPLLLHHFPTAYSDLRP
jgi:hypothetical protein